MLTIGRRLVLINSRVFRFSYLRAFSSEHGVNVHEIRMPDIMDKVNGTVDKWLVKEGDHVNSGQSLCEVTLDEEISLAIEAKESGVMTSILVREGVPTDVKTSIAQYVLDAAAYDEILEHRKKEASAAAAAAAAAAATTATTHVEGSSDERAANSSSSIDSVPASVIPPPVVEESRPDMAVLLKAVRHLMATEKLDANSDLAKHLQTLARKGNAELMGTFEASFEGIAFNEETFDVDFFLDNAKQIVDEYVEKEKNQ